jgi:hypothetical protein
MKINERLFFLLRVIIELVVDAVTVGVFICRSSPSSASASSSAELSSSSS